jgi:type IV pilus assembly protein PilB
MDDAILTAETIRHVVLITGSWLVIVWAWAAASGWIDRDARFVFGSSVRWSIGMALIGAAILTSAVLAGFIGLPAIAATLAVVCGAYLRQRETHVPAPHRILTASRTRSLLAPRRRADREPPAGRRAAAHDDDDGVVLVDRDGMPQSVPPRGRRHRQAARAAQAARDLVAEALSARATRLRIDSRPDGRMRARFELDGSWTTHARLDGPDGYGLSREVRRLAGLSRDGRPRRRAGFTAVIAGRTVEFRGRSEAGPSRLRMEFTIVDPDANGGRHDFRVGLDGTRLPRRTCESIRSLVQQPRGAILVCGPAGSGRTTTAYALITEIDPHLHPIVTIEESITARLEHVTQTAVGGAAGPTAAQVLSGLRPGDAAAILLDGITDRETAAAALRAAAESTVVATLEAEDAADAIVRLLALGVEPHALGTAVVGVVAQRLVRALCDQCKVSATAPPDLVRKLPDHGDGELTVFTRGKGGCVACHGTGYRGRVPVHELLLVDEPLLGLLADRPTRARIRAQARDAGMRTLRESALALVAAGVTSVKEIVRVVP